MEVKEPISLSQEDVEVLVKMASFQIKVINKIPKEMLKKAMMEAVLSGDVKPEDMPLPDEVDRLCDTLGIPTSSSQMN